MEQKIIETKQEWAWHFIYQYLDFLDRFAIPQTDEVYQKKLHDLLQYVIDKIDVDGEITDFFVTVLHTAED